MRYLFLLLLFVSLGAQAQSSKQPFKGANTIVVQLPDSGVTAWKRVAQKLNSLGYVIKSSDKDLLTISTEQKATPNAAVYLAPTLMINGSTLELRGKYGQPSIPNSPVNIPLEFKGMKGFPAMISWDELTRIGASVGVISSYEKR
jgi:hypothetical protein